MKSAPLNPSGTHPARPSVESDAAVLRAGRGRRAERSGYAAERAAEAALVAEGWAVLARRERNASGEIDLVVRRGDMICFVEVKARASLADAAFSLSARQQARLMDAAALALAEHPDWTAADHRFDLLLVDPAGRVRRIADAFRTF